MELNLNETDKFDKRANFKKFLLKQEKMTLVEFILNTLDTSDDTDYYELLQKFKKTKNVNINHTVEMNNIETKCNTNTSNVVANKKIISFSDKTTYAFKFLYFGHDYDGLVMQQDTSNTVEEKILQSFFKCKLIDDIKSCNFSRCGRTDKGVSAFGNVFNIDIRNVNNYDYTRIINRLLPSDIRIISQSKVDLTFDSRFSCLFREYKYFFIKKSFNIELMKEAAQKLIGEHNFYNFCKLDKSKLDEDGNSIISYNRRIFEIEILKSFDNNEDFYSIYYFQIKGSVFLWHQIRCIMAILFSIGSGKEPIELIDTLLNENEKRFNYQIADDFPLILSNFEFEGVDFNCSDEAFADNIFTLSSLFEKKLLEYSIFKFMFENFATHVKSINGCDNNIGSYINYYKKTNPEMRIVNKYTQILNRKRDKD